MSSSPTATGLPGPEEALGLLMAGNRRWAGGQVAEPNRSVSRRESLAGGQSPFAVILSCIDSRVPPELIFDCGLGDLLVVRSAGHTLDDIVLGSVEFGPCHLRTPLIVVLGHQGCGAVAAAVLALRDDRWPPGHISDVIDALRPAYRAAGGDVIDAVVRAHTALTVARLRREKAFAGMLGTNRLSVVGCYYDLATGTVDMVS